MVIPFLASGAYRLYDYAKLEDLKKKKHKSLITREQNQGKLNQQCLSLHYGGFNYYPSSHELTLIQLLNIGYGTGMGNSACSAQHSAPFVTVDTTQT